MAEIVILDTWRGKQGRRPEIRIGEPADAGSAQLLMFTGIRYERLEPMPSKHGRNTTMFFEQN